jgi:cytochrome c biogenesis protein CcmG/thiol:disulfide interchange protein DsbE
VVVNFWASWCQGCKLEHENLIDAWKRYSPKGVAFVGIVFNDGAGDARAFMQRHGGAWTVVKDPEQQTAVDYGVAQIPETFVIDRKGVVRFKSAGPITSAGPVTPQLLSRELDQMMRERA